MATHDYVIDNSTGANVRADINNVLQAILTNNSSSSAPSTTAAYMFWADTTTGTLKIRNSSDNAWVELLQLDGTLTLEDGSASTPGLAFRDDLNTGIFSGGADELAVSTGGTERVKISSSEIVINESGADFDIRIEGDSFTNLVRVDGGNQRIGLNTSAPEERLHVVGQIISTSSNATSSTSGSGRAIFDFTGGGARVGHFRGTTSAGSGSTSFFVDSSEKARIDSSGRLLINHTTVTPVDNDANNPIFQVEGTGGDDSRISIRHNSTTAGNAASIYLSRSKGTSTGSKTSVAENDALGNLIFMGADGTHDTRAAIIQASCDGTPGDNDMPGRLEFLTTPDGALNATEKMRITAAGNVGIGTTSPVNILHVNSGATNTAALFESSDTEVSIQLKDTTGSSVIKARNDFRFDNSTGELMRIDSSGNVGIGTTDPAGESINGTQNLVIMDTTSDGGMNIKTGTSANAQIHFSDTSGNGRGRLIYAHSDDSMQIYTAGSERMRILSDGRVGIGDTTPSCTLEMVGTSVANFGSMPETIISYGTTSAYNSGSAGAGLSLGGYYNSTPEFTIFAGVHGAKENTNDGNFAGKLLLSTRANGGDSAARVKITSNGSFVSHGEIFYATSFLSASNNVPFAFYTGGSSVDSVGSVKCRIHGDGDIENVNGNYGSISDIKLKENIVDANSQWDDIKAIKIRNYNFKAETTYPTHTQIGLIAQELELVCPKLVTETSDVDSENKELGTVTKSVNLSVLYMKAVKCLQEAMTKIEVLETKVAALEAA